METELSAPSTTSLLKARHPFSDMLSLSLSRNWWWKLLSGNELEVE